MHSIFTAADGPTFGEMIWSTVFIPFDMYQLTDKTGSQLHQDCNCSIKCKASDQHNISIIMESFDWV